MLTQLKRIFTGLVLTGKTGNIMHLTILANLYNFAVELIQKGLAYVDDQPADLISAQKGTPSQPGIESPFRDRMADLES